MALQFLNDGYFAGKVGIGTESPGAKLEIKDGDLWLNGVTSSYNPEIFFIDDAGPTGIAGAKIRYGNTDGNLYFDHKWDTATSGFFFRNRVDGTALNTMSLVNGKVGIRTTSPSTTFHVDASNLTNNVATYIGGAFVANDLYHREGGLLVISGTNATQTSAGIAFQTRNTGNSNYWKSSMLMNRNGELEFYTGGLGTVQGTRRITITSTGNVGIGETSPLAKLHIKTSSTSNTNQLLLESTDAGATSGPDLALYRNSASPADGDVLGALWFYGNNSTPVQELYSGILSIANDVTDGTEDSEIRFLNMVNGTLQTPMTINGLNVGIGTISPNAKLEVKGTNTAGDLALSNSSTTVSSGDTLGKLAFRNYDASVNFSTFSGEVASIRAVAAVDFTGTNGANTDLLFYTNSVSPANGSPVSGGSEKMRILANGNVGIGTTSPTRLLQLNSSGQTDLHLTSTSQGVGASDGMTVFLDSSGTGGLWLREAQSLRFATNSSEKMTILSGGDVGIGTTSPTEKLEVVGNIKITAALLSNQENTDVDTGAETIASVAIATYTAAFFDFVIKKTTNVRSGTVYACHDGTNVEFTETSTQDLGDTSDVTLSVDISGTDMRLRATTTSDDWIIKSLIRAI